MSASRIFAWAMSIVILLAGAIIFVTSEVLEKGFLPSCSYELVGRFPSPYRRLTALVVVANCGATTPFVTTVGVGSTDAFDIRAESYFFKVKGWNDSKVIWDGNDSLTVIYERPDLMYPGSTNSELIYRQDKMWRDLRISYREK